MPIAQTVGDGTPEGNCGFLNRPVGHVISVDDTHGHMWALAIEIACSENVGYVLGIYLQFFKQVCFLSFIWVVYGTVTGPCQFRISLEIYGPTLTHRCYGMYLPYQRI